MPDPELQASLLAPSPEDLAAVKVFPLIPAIKKDVIVSIFPDRFWGFQSVDSSFPREQLVRTTPTSVIYSQLIRHRR